MVTNTIKWILQSSNKTQLLPNISPNSLIVMDNAPYHPVLREKMPTISWKKSDLRDWLVKKGAQPSEDMMKMELYNMAKNLCAWKN